MNKEKGRVVYPAASFQPPDSCPECLAGVPFDEQGQHAQPAETPWEDLRVRALQDYEDKATATHSWSSVIPQAINFYFDNFRRLSAAPITQDSASASALSQDVPDESSVLRLYNLLKEYGQHKKGCTVETTDCICGFSSKISKLVPPSESESTLVTVDEAAVRRAAFHVCAHIVELAQTSPDELFSPSIDEVADIIATELSIYQPDVHPERLHIALHKLWTKAVGQEGYVKAEWRELDDAIFAALAASPVQPEVSSR